MFTRKMVLRLSITLIVLLAALGFELYHLVVGGGSVPLTLVFLLVIGLALLRIPFRLRRELRDSAGE